MNVEDPIYIEDTESYTFFITNAPVYALHISNTAAKAPLDSIVNIHTDEFRQCLFRFVEEFLQKTSEHFPSSLSAASFLEDIVHEWTDPYEQLQGHSAIYYTPIQIVLNTSGYKIVWAFQSKDPGYPGNQQHSLQLGDVCSSFEEPPSTPAESESHFNAPVHFVPPIHYLPVAPASAPATIDEIESIDISSIPCSEDAIPLNPELSHLRARERRLIRETRLRAEMTRLRAETLAQRYLKKYGNTHAADAESVLSFSSDSE